MSALRDALRDLPDAVFFDLLESDEAYLLVLDVPGVSADTLDFTAEDGRLVVEAQREKALPDEFQYVAENRSMFVDLELPLPTGVSGENAETSVERGVLELWLPKDDDVETTIDIVEDEGV